MLAAALLDLRGDGQLGLEPAQAIDDPGGRGLGVIGRRAALDQTGGAEVLWTTIFCTATLGIAGLVLLTVAERMLLRWHASQRS